MICTNPSPPVVSLCVSPCHCQCQFHNSLYSEGIPSYWGLNPGVSPEAEAESHSHTRTKLSSATVYVCSPNLMTLNYTCITCGVPQGSMHSPALFVDYMYDLQSVVQSDAYLFDTKIFRIITQDTDITHLQEDLRSVSNWCDHWWLKVNPEEHLHTGKWNNNIVNDTIGDLVVQQVEE